MTSEQKPSREERSIEIITRAGSSQVKLQVTCTSEEELNEWSSRLSAVITEMYEKYHRPGWMQPPTAYLRAMLAAY